MKVALAVVVAVVALVHRVHASCCSGMTMSQSGLSLTEGFEGLVQHVYNDPVGNPTVCYGHLVTPGETFPPTVSMQECQQLLQQDMGSAESCVQNNVNVQLSQNQFNALVDFTYNLGCGALQGSTLLRDLNQGNYGAVPGQMLLWNHANGQVLPGLTRRRQAEANMWSSGSSGNSQSQGSLPPPPPPPPSSYVGVPCGNGGSCIDTDNSQCSGNIQHGLCPGPANILCCIDTSPQQYAGTSCSNGAGTCINTDYSSCSDGSIQYNECPGGDNILCCVNNVGTSCDGGDGTCINVNTQACSTQTLINYCPGPAQVQCCPQGSGSSSNDSSGSNDNENGGSSSSSSNSNGGGDDYYYEENTDTEGSSKPDSDKVIAITVGVVAVVALAIGAATIVAARRRRFEL